MPKFKYGDKVEIINCNSDFNGKIVTILGTTINEYSTTFYIIEFPEVLTNYYTKEKFKAIQMINSCLKLVE